MKILVCGGREFQDKDLLYKILDELLMYEENMITHVIHGDARGADHLAQGWAVSKGIQPVRCPALWDIHGSRAGLLRNEAMLDLDPDVVIAFPGGRGTAHMVRIARAAKFRVICVGEPPLPDPPKSA